MGGKATIIEKRNNFTRDNTVKLWPFSVEDLKGLGLDKDISNRGVSHITVKSVQSRLYKVCLLLGVTVHFDAAFHGVKAIPGAITPSTIVSFAKKQPGGAPAKLFELAAHTLIDCGGQNGPSAEHFDFEVLEETMGSAYGVVATFERPNEDKTFTDFTWAKGNSLTKQSLESNELTKQSLEKFNTIGSVLADSDTDRPLENVTYFCGKVHYFVATAELSNLQDWGVVTQQDGRFVQNLDKTKEYTRKIATHFGIPEDREFTQNPAFFDFSKRQRCSEAAKIVYVNEQGDISQAWVEGSVPFVVQVAGDRLMEPFWPEGLGISRGSLTAFDAVWALGQYSDAVKNKKGLLSLLAYRHQLFNCMKSLSSFRREMLQEDIKKYTLDPATRYTNLPQSHYIINQIMCVGT